MKKIFKLTIFSFLILTASCEKFLELEPLGTQLESNYYQSERDAFTALVAIYDVLGWGGSAGVWSMFHPLSDVASDDCYAGGSDASDQPNWVAVNNFTVNPNLGPQAGFWNKYYAGIYRANLFLEKIEIIEDASPEFKARTIAEAKFLRAYFYYHLGQLFGNVPLITEPLGADAYYTQTQATQAEVFAQVEQDLRDAINTIELPETVGNNELGRITKGAAKALLARVILFQNQDGKMAEAANLCEEVINSGIYFLNPDFAEIFTLNGEHGPESVFEIQYSGNQRGGWENFVNQTEGNYTTQFIGIRDYNGPTYSAGWSFCPVTEDLVAFMQGDPRFAHTIIDGNALKSQGATYTEGYQNTDYFIKKNAPLAAEKATEGEPALNWSNNIREIRYADVLLMAAEALVRSGGDEGRAKMYLNEVRQRVGLQPITSPSGQALLDIIYDERRMELAFEGLRFWDLVRTNRAENVLASQGYRPGISHFLPIPQAEIDKTRGGGGNLNQNNGY